MARQGDSIGQRLRSRRVALALSQDAVAEAIGVSQVQVAKYETGQNQVPIDKVGALVDILNIDVSELLGIAPHNGAPSPWAIDIARKLECLPLTIKRDLGALINDLFDKGPAQ